MAEIDWEKLQNAAIAYRQSKGFIPVSWDTAAARLGCIIKEIIEVEDALCKISGTTSDYVEHAIELARFELADVVLYILTIQYDLGFPVGTARVVTHTPIMRFTTPADMTRWLRTYWGSVFHAWQHRNKKDMNVALDLLIAQVDAIHHRIDPTRSLEHSCYEKLELMRERSPLHGGKDPST